VADLVVENDRLLHAHADNGARAVPVVLQALEAHGIVVTSVTVARPSLDDVYLRYKDARSTQAESESAEVKKR